MFGFFRKRRRAKAMTKPFPVAWLEIVRENMPLYERLPEEDQQALQQHLQVFLQEKRFEGCGDLTITDEIRVTIAAQACVLLLRRPMNYYPKLRSILVYPREYVSKALSHDENGFASEAHQHRLGESWSSGSVVLSWNAARSGGEALHDGQNVVFHEFAHQLDQESGQSDGAPILGRDLAVTERRSKYVSWARVMQSEFDHLQFQTRHGKRALMDDYGATNPAEFFAVATETFFEKPKLLQKRHPELYQELKGYYRQDPNAWPWNVDHEDSED